MNFLVEEKINCPYCGERESVLIDASVDQQSYIEDCQVCCRPIRFEVYSYDDQAPSISVFSENE